MTIDWGFLDLKDSSIFPRNVRRQEIHKNIMNYLGSHIQDFKSLDECPLETLQSAFKSWTQLLSLNFYTLFLHRPVQMSECLSYQEALRYSSSQLPHISDFMMEIDLIIKDKHWGSVGVLMWTHLVKIIREIYLKTLVKSPELWGNNVDLHTEIVKFIGIFDRKCKDDEITLKAKTFEFFGQVGCLFLKRPGTVYEKVATLYLFVYTWSRFDYGLVFPGYEIDQADHVTWINENQMFELLKSELPSYDPENQKVNRIIRDIVILCQYPSVNRIYVFERIFRDPKFMLRRQIEMDWFRLKIQQDCFRVYQPDMYTYADDEFNTAVHDFDYFWTDEDSEFYSAPFKLRFFHDIIQKYTNYGGFGKTFVCPHEGAKRFRFELITFSGVIPMFVFIKPYIPILLKNGKIIEGSIHKLLYIWLTTINELGCIPRTGPLELVPWLYIHKEANPSLDLSKCIITSPIRRGLFDINHRCKEMKKNGDAVIGMDGEVLEQSTRIRLAREEIDIHEDSVLELLETDD